MNLICQKFAFNFNTHSQLRLFISFSNAWNEMKISQQKHPHLAFGRLNGCWTCNKPKSVACKQLPKCQTERKNCQQRIKSVFLPISITFNVICSLRLLLYAVVVAKLSGKLFILIIKNRGRVYINYLQDICRPFEVYWEYITSDWAQNHLSNPIFHHIKNIWTRNSYWYIRSLSLLINLHGPRLL